MNIHDFPGDDNHTFRPHAELPAAIHGCHYRRCLAHGCHRSILTLLRPSSTTIYKLFELVKSARNLTHQLHVPEE